MAAILRKRLTDLDIGQMIETDNVQKGILIALGFQHQHHGLGHFRAKFDYFAAPQDLHVLDGLEQLDTFESSVRRVAALKNVLGHDGIASGNYCTTYYGRKTEILLAEEDEIFELHDDRDDGSHHTSPEAFSYWHLPTIFLQSGINTRILNDEQIKQRQLGLGCHNNPDNIFSLKDRGALMGTFRKANYWSISPCLTSPEIRHFLSTNFANDVANTACTDQNARLLSRPVRAELRMD
jgi:hypothetical protein